MESKKHLLEIIEKADLQRRDYLDTMFQYIPEAVAREMVYAEVKKNDYIIRAGSPSDTVYVILKGQVVGEEHQRMGRIYSFMDFAKMYVVGDFEIFTDRTEYCASIRAEQDCRLLKISAKSYFGWIRHDDNALFLRLRNILKNFDFEKDLEREWLFLGCKERLADYLIRLYEREQKKGERLKIEKNQAELADKVGYNVRSVQRSIAAFENENLISMEKGKITISYEQYLLLKQFEDGKGDEHGKV